MPYYKNGRCQVSFELETGGMGIMNFIIRLRAPKDQKKKKYQLVN